MVIVIAQVVLKNEEVIINIHYSPLIRQVVEVRLRFILKNIHLESQDSLNSRLFHMSSTKVSYE